MNTEVGSPPAARAGAGTNDSREPAVIGVEPWSWKGDDNNGNMIHAAAARRLISRYTEYPKPDRWTEADIDRVRSQHSHIVFITANLIRLGVPRDDPSIRELISSQLPLAKNIERVGLPVVVFGLGSQAALNGPFEFAVAPETARLLRVISDHSRRVAVRGEFTAEACARLGVKNVEVVGCQSIFWHRSPQFSLKLTNTMADRPGKIAFNFTNAHSEARLINQAIAGGYDFIGQGNTAEENFKEQKAGTNATAPVEFGWDVGPALERGLIDRAQYERWIRNHFYQFQRPGPWLEHMRRYCFSYGTRLHGNMAAMIAGVRAMWILHDMRLKEVLDHFQLPRIEYKEARDGVNLETLFDRADYSECAKVYPDRYRTLYEYVVHAGLPNSLPAPVGGTQLSSCGGAAAYQGAPAFRAVG